MFKFFKDLIRILYIKKKKAISVRICKKCGDIIYPKEKYFSVNRWYHDRQITKMAYCTACIKTRKEVLKEIESDNHPYGIAFVDPSKKLEKK